MKKAISLLTSLMVMSLVAANMAIPASADGGVTFDIDDVTVNLEDLSTDANGNYIVNVPVFSTDTTDTGSYSSVLKFDFAKEGVGYVSDGDSMVFVENGGVYAEKDISSTVEKERILYLNGTLTPESRPVNGTETIYTLQLTIPSTAKAGDTFALNWDDSVVDVTDLNEEDLSSVVTLENGSITVGGETPADTTTTANVPSGDGMVIKAEDVVLDTDEITEDTTVKVPIKVTNNVGFASGLWANTLTSNSSVTATWSKDFVGVEDGNLFGSKDVEGNAPNGRVLYLNSNTQNVSEDGTLCYVEVVIPAGAKAGDTFEVGFDNSVADYTNADEQEIPTPTYVGGTITIGSAVPDTTTVTTEGTTVTTTGASTGSMNISASNKDVDVTDILSDGVTSEDLTVQVPIVVTGNTGFASGLWANTLTSNSSVTATWSDTFVATADGDLFGAKDVEGYASNGRVLYLNSNTEDVTGDGSLCYVEVVIPAGAKVGDTFEVGFDSSVSDYTNANEQALDTPTYSNGVITLTGEATTTTSATEPTTTTAPVTEPTTVTTTANVPTGDGMTISAEDVTIEGDVTEDITVKVPIKVTNNVGFASGLWANTLTSNSSVTATWSGDFVGVQEGDLFGAKDVEGNAPNGRVLYLNANTEDVTGDGSLCYVEVVIPAGAKVGDTFEVGFDSSVADYTNASEEELATPTYVGGTITIVGGTDTEPTTTTTVATTAPVTEPTTTTTPLATTTVTTTTVTSNTSFEPTATTTAVTQPTTVTTTSNVATDGITLTADSINYDISNILADGVTKEAITVNVPIKVVNNPGFASGLWGLNLSSDSSVTATWSKDFAVVNEDCIVDSKEIEGVVSTQRVLYLSNTATDLTKDGTICYVQVVIPAGAKVGDKFNVSFNENVNDFSNEAGDVVTPKFAGGVIVLGNGSDTPDTTTTGVTTPNVTTTTNGSVTTTTGKGDTTTTTSGKGDTTTTTSGKGDTTTTTAKGTGNNNNNNNNKGTTTTKGSNSSANTGSTGIVGTVLAMISAGAAALIAKKKRK